MSIQERIDALWDQNGAIWTAFPGVSNAAKWLENLKSMPEDISDTLMSAVEFQDSILKKQYDNTEYIRLRAAAYPPLTDQLDVIFHGGVDTWKADIQAIKDLYPKPEGV